MLGANWFLMKINSTKVQIFQRRKWSNPLKIIHVKIVKKHGIHGKKTENNVSPLCPALGAIERSKMLLVCCGLHPGVAWPAPGA
ncbi:hypothetical protein A2U01_0042384, partial [Trifolium medium]|nr:hypothetical protein [Trifolium medium]